MQNLAAKKGFGSSTRNQVAGRVQEMEVARPSCPFWNWVIVIHLCSLFLSEQKKTARTWPCAKKMRHSPGGSLLVGSKFGFLPFMFGAGATAEIEAAVVAVFVSRASELESQDTSAADLEAFLILLEEAAELLRHQQLLGLVPPTKQKWAAAVGLYQRTALSNAVDLVLNHDRSAVLPVVLQQALLDAWLSCEQSLEDDLSQRVAECLPVLRLTCLHIAQRATPDPAEDVDGGGLPRVGVLMDFLKQLIEAFHIISTIKKLPLTNPQKISITRVWAVVAWGFCAWVVARLNSDNRQIRLVPGSLRVPTKKAPFRCIGTNQTHQGCVGNSWLVRLSKSCCLFVLDQGFTPESEHVEQLGKLECIQLLVDWKKKLFNAEKEATNQALKELCCVAAQWEARQEPDAAVAQGVLSFCRSDGEVCVLRRDLVLRTDRVKMTALEASEENLRNCSAHLESVAGGGENGTSWKQGLDGAAGVQDALRIAGPLLKGSLPIKLMTAFKALRQAAHWVWKNK